MNKETEKASADVLGEIFTKNCPPSPTEIADSIVRFLGDRSTCLKNPTLALEHQEVSTMIEKLDEEDRKRIGKYIGFFGFHMECLYLFTEEKRGKSWAFYERKVRSSVALLVMFSIIEDRTKEATKDFTTYLKENFDTIKNKIDIDRLAKEQREAFPKNVSRVKNFYTKFLTQKEKDNVIKVYKSEKRSAGGKDFNSIEKVIDDIYSSMRSGFAHSVGIDHLWSDNYKFVWKGGKENSQLIAAYPELSIDWFLALSWLATLRSFGYPK